MDETLEEYFRNHPDEEEEFLAEISDRLYLDEPIDYPDDWIY